MSDKKYIRNDGLDTGARISKIYKFSSGMNALQSYSDNYNGDITIFGRENL